MSDTKDWKYLILHNGEKVKVDLEDFEKVSQHKWYIIQQRNSGKKQAVTNIKTEKGYRQITLGRFIMNPPKGQYVYPRRSREILDYRKQNLIVCTMRERQIMLPKRKSKCSSSYKGVTWDKSKEMWRSHIDIKGQTRTIGFFKSEEEAAHAYNKKAKMLYGDIAYQNQIDKKHQRRQSDAS